MRIGIVGAGMIGSTVATLFVDAGHEVRVASRHPDQLRILIAQLGRRASAGTPAEAAAFGELVVLTVPLAAVPDLAKELAPLLKGKVVLDTGNAYERRDGATAREASTNPKGSAGWAAAMFPGSRWVKAFNTVYYKTLQQEAHRKGEKVGIPIASDDRLALETTQQLVQQAGFEPVVVGALARGKEFEPDTPPYNTGMSGQDLKNYWGERTETHATRH